MNAPLLRHMQYVRDSDQQIDGHQLPSTLHQMTTLVSAISALVATVLTGCASTRPGFIVDVPIASRYVFRAVVLDDNPVLQPRFSVEQELTTGVISAALWSNFELGDDHGLEHNVTEVDATLDYSMSLGRVGLSLGAARYEYPHTGVTGSTEVYALLSVTDLLVIPSIEVWYDCDELDGAYFNFNLSREFELAQGWTLSALAGVGWMDSEQGLGYFGVHDSGASDALLQLTLDHPLSENSSFALIGNWASVLDHDYRNAVSEPDNAWIAAGISFGF